MRLHIVKPIYTQQRSKSINIDEIRRRPPTDMNLHQWSYPSHILSGGNLKHRKSKRNRFVKSKMQKSRLKKPICLSSTLIDYRRWNRRNAIFFSEELKMLPETFLLEEFCFVVKWLVHHMKSAMSALRKNRMH